MMPEKKQPKHDEEEDEVQAEAVDAPEVSEAELEDLRKRVDQLDARAAENLQGWQRAVADFQNYKKRLERDRESDKAAMKGDLVRRFLPVLDDLQRALRDRPAGDAWADGIELIVRKFESVLQSEGITRIEAEGQPFDPNFHEAISYEPADGVASGNVIGVVQNGYMLGEYVIRPAQVRVAR